MRLYQYEDIQKLNQALGSFKINGIPVKKVKLLTVGPKTHYFVLTDADIKPKKLKKVQSTGKDEKSKKVTKKPTSK